MRNPVKRDHRPRLAVRLDRIRVPVAQALLEQSLNKADDFIRPLNRLQRGTRLASAVGVKHRAFLQQPDQRRRIPESAYAHEFAPQLLMFRPINRRALNLP